MLPGGLTAESSHDLVRRRFRPWRPGFGRLAFACPVSWPAAVSLVSLLSLRPPLFHEQVGVQMMETVPRHFLAWTGVGKATRDAFLRHFAHPHVRGTRKRPLRRAPLSASHFRCGVRPCPVLFVTTQPAALGPRRGSFLPVAKLQRCPSPVDAHQQDWSREGPVDPTQGDDREWTNVDEDGFGRADLCESQPTVYLESCPVRIPPPPSAP